MQENNEETIKSLKDDNNIKKYVIILVIILFIFGIVQIISMTQSKKKTNTKEPQNSEVPEEVDNETKEDQSKALTYFKNVNIFQDNTIDEYGYFYNEDSITKDTMKSKVKIIVALYNLTKNLNNSNPINFTKQEVSNKIETIFENSEYTDESVKVNCMNFTFENDMYKGTPISCNQNTNEKIVTKMISTKEEDNKVTIEEKFALLSKEDNKIRLYRSLKKDKNNLIDILKIKNFDEFLIDNYQSSLYTYRWVLNKVDNNHYTFNKVEKVQNCSLEKMC